MSRLPQKFQAGVTKIQGWVERARRKKAEAEERKLQAGAEEEGSPRARQPTRGYQPSAHGRL